MNTGGDTLVDALPMRRRLAFRIVALFLGLLLLVQVVTFALVQRSIDHNARELLGSSLDLGEQVFRRLLRQSATHLSESTRLLAADYGFREALSSGDTETLVSALDNHGERAGASFSIITDAQGKVQASTGPRSAELTGLVQRAIRQAESTEDPGESGVIVAMGKQVLQLVAVPIRAPLTIGWVVMGYQLDERLVRDMKQLTAMSLVIVTRTQSGGWQAALSLLGEDARQSLLGQWMPAASASAATGANRMSFELPDGLHVARLHALGNDAQVPIYAVMLRSVDAAVAPFQQLQLAILALNGFGVLAFAIGSAMTARRITTPVTSLTRLAARLARGDFNAPIPRHGDDEIGELAEAFESMRQAVHQRESEIRRSGLTDSLTRLPNRAGFTIAVRDAVARAVAQNTGCAVVMLNLDRFRHVNNVLGTDAGDQLLQRVARLLHDKLNEAEHTVARLGGDEFAILLAHGGIDEALAVSRRVQQGLEATIDLNGSTVDLGAGIGIAACPTHATDDATLMRRAELAMHHAKQAQTGCTIFRPELDVKSDAALSLLGELRQAVEQNEFRLFLQPKVCLRNGSVVGAEALIRWAHPARGMVPPGLFIPFAEQSGFIRQITSWLLVESMRTWRRCADQGLRLQMSINLSARDLIDPELPARVSALLQEHQVPASAMCLEITESAIMDDPNRAQQTLEQFHDMGLQMSIDDFGTGYSSLAYLKRLPVHELKIDRSFVMNMHHDAQDAKIVRSVVDLAHNLGLKVTAEGLEEGAAWGLLGELGCDIAQGYWIAKPMPADQLPQWVSSWVPPVQQASPELAEAH
ncbi:putative bifunctional diguanylate cyclase/phosphodiesterase [Aquabacterium sp. UBA2148]|uniref:putative bifunctional diguanylate cyclase/phosphodiesterase n=1 Tax=Aquabacterium sp. UBA2148 TaxID=1946042 RepID=UPI002579BB86|nr:EAL domain-containing protein [Aquabacterium sp. UBA2148]